MSMNRREFLEDSSKLLSTSLLPAGAATVSGAGGLPQAANRKFRLIDTEVHFSFPEHLEALRRLTEGLYNNWDLSTWAGPPEKHALFSDVEDGKRIDVMDKAGVDVAVLSLAEPGVQMFDADTATNLAAQTNDRLAEAIKKHPTRYAGFATFAPQDPAKAAKEIDRAMNKLKLNALLVNSHTNGEYLDDKKFWPILEAAQAVNAPLYIHPRTVPDSVAPLLNNAPSNLRAAPWGFPSETSLHALRLIFNGIFEQFPNLKVALGHMGEGIPFWRYRIDYWYRGGGIGGGYPEGLTAKLKKPSEYFRTNFMITTSGMNSHPALEYCHEVLGPEQIMWASDYPYQPEMNEASEFMNMAPLPVADVEKIAHGNAEKFFRIVSV
jgi:5-carboxyvanillate decarboxylase